MRAELPESSAFQLHVCEIRASLSPSEFQGGARCTKPARLPRTVLNEQHPLALTFGAVVADAILEGDADGRRTSLRIQEGSGTGKEEWPDSPQTSERSSQRDECHLLSEHPVSRAHRRKHKNSSF